MTPYHIDGVKTESPECQFMSIMPDRHIEEYEALEEAPTKLHFFFVRICVTD